MSFIEARLWPVWTELAGVHAPICDRTGFVTWLLGGRSSHREYRKENQMTAIVETTAGKVEGLEKGGLSIFLGIPFAAPPVGKRRWLPPEPVEPWAGVRKSVV